MHDIDLLTALRTDLSKPAGYVRYGTLQAVCRRAAAAGDRAFAAAVGTNRERLLAGVRAAAGVLAWVEKTLAAGG
jgi:hypothetical protein